MEQQFSAYKKKLYKNRLVPHGKALLGIAGEKINRPRDHEDAGVADMLLENLPAGAILLYARPAEPYGHIIDYLAENADGAIYPDDSETRGFLHDLPVVKSFPAGAGYKPPPDRKCVLIKNHGIAVYGQIEPSEAYIRFSAACFACFVKFFSDFLTDSKNNRLTRQQRNTFLLVSETLQPEPRFEKALFSGPFNTAGQARTAMIEAGKHMVSMGLVDACFGNISYRVGNMLYISAAGSFLDELEDDIAACSADTGNPGGEWKKPSSELPAHLEIVHNAEIKGVMHGHPVFSVIMSMDCDIECDNRGMCHRLCPHERRILGTPVVSGETGGGKYGLSTTVPEKVRREKGVIVYGHGVFTGATADFNEALNRMAHIEQKCRKEYFSKISDPSPAPSQLGL